VPEKTAQPAAEGAPEAPAAAPGKKKKLWIVLAIVLAVSGIGGAAATLAIPKPTPTAAPATAASSEIVGYFEILDLKSNLSRSGGLHFCMLELAIEYRTKNGGAAETRLGLKTDPGGTVPYPTGPVATAIRDRLILLLASKGIEDLEGREKKDLLKKEIQAELQPLVFPDKDGDVKQVLFKDFLLQ
jgi:flagellar basal body-associated protein FliL